MRTTDCIESRVELGVYPSRCDLELTQFTLGDLHGNPIKLLYALIRHGICRLDRPAYAQLVALYQTKPLSAAAIAECCRIITTIDVIDRQKLVRLIGDVLADRGNNDWITLQLLDTLRLGGVPVRILMSNHDDQFMRFFNDVNDWRNLQAHTDLYHPERNLDQGCSYSAFVQYIISASTDAEKTQRFNEAKRMLRESYLPNLVLLDYSLSADGNEMTLLSHAPIALMDIEAVARQFRIDWKVNADGKPVQALVDAICTINQVYQTRLQLGLHTQMMNSAAVKKIAWQRVDNQYDERTWRLLELGLIQQARDPRAGTSHIHFVHGHDEPDNPDQIAPNVSGLDNLLGKESPLDNPEADRRVAFVSDELITPGVLIRQRPTRENLDALIESIALRRHVSSRFADSASPQLVWAAARDELLSHYQHQLDVINSEKISFKSTRDNLHLLEQLEAAAAALSDMIACVQTAACRIKTAPTPPLPPQRTSCLSNKRIYEHQLSQLKQQIETPLGAQLTGDRRDAYLKALIHAKQVLRELEAQSFPKDESLVCLIDICSHVSHGLRYIAGAGKPFVSNALYRVGADKISVGVHQVSYDAAAHSAAMTHLAEMAADLPATHWRHLRHALFALSAVLLVAASVCLALVAPPLGIGLGVALGAVGLFSIGGGILVPQTTELAKAVHAVQQSL